MLIKHPAAHSQHHSGINAGKNQLLNYPRPIPIVEPHLAVNPHNNDHMIAAAIVYDSAATSDIATHIVVFTTKDNGKTWKHTDLPMSVGFDPWVAIKNDKDVVLVAMASYNNTHHTNLVYHTSQDGGFTWSKEAVSLGPRHDHPTLIVDRKHNDRLYLLSSVTKRNAAKEHLFYGYLNFSDDWKTFGDPASYFSTGTTNSNTLTAAVDNIRRRVLLPYIEFTAIDNQPRAPVIKMVTSADDKNFTSPLVITKKTGVSKGFPVFAIDNGTKYPGRMYLVKNSGADPKRSEGIYRNYADNDNAWSVDIRVDHNDKNEKYMRTAAMAVNKDGVVGIAWCDRRNDPGLKKNDIYFTISRDGGKSFENETRITEVSSDPLTPQNAKAAERHAGGGDYMGCVAKPDGSFQVVWAESRSGVYQLYTSNIKL